MSLSKSDRITVLEKKMSIIEEKIGEINTIGFSVLEGVEASNPQLGAVITLSDFLATAGELMPAQRKTIVRQALTLIEDIYVHLLLKRAMHAIIQYSD